MTNLIFFISFNKKFTLINFNVIVLNQLFPVKIIDLYNLIICHFKFFAIEFLLLASAFACSIDSTIFRASRPTQYVTFLFKISKKEMQPLQLYAVGTSCTHDMTLAG